MCKIVLEAGQGQDYKHVTDRVLSANVDYQISKFKLGLAQSVRLIAAHTVLPQRCKCGRLDLQGRKDVVLDVVISKW
jgi:hypothetical protein